MKKSYLAALSITAVMVVWMLSGVLAKDEPVRESGVADQAERDRDIMVEVQIQQAQSVELRLASQGFVEPSRSVMVRAETSGRVVEVLAQEGATVKAGSELVRLDINDRNARLKQAKAKVEEWDRAVSRAQSMGDKGYQSKQFIENAMTELRSAQAELEQVQQEIQNTVIRAPFDGTLEEHQVELGDYVTVNGAVASIVDNDPLQVSIQVPQQDIGKIRQEARAHIAFATGQQGEGVVRYIAARADDATRTFKVKIEVPNPDNHIRSGISAGAIVPTGQVMAHFISPALLTLDEDGMVGVKTVTGERRVVFYPVDIVMSDTSGVWVSGLPSEAHIISVGQGFVQDGDSVRVASTPMVNPVAGATQ